MGIDVTIKKKKHIKSTPTNISEKKLKKWVFRDELRKPLNVSPVWWWRLWKRKFTKIIITAVDYSKEGCLSTFRCFSFLFHTRHYQTGETFNGLQSSSRKNRFFYFFREYLLRVLFMWFFFVYFDDKLRLRCCCGQRNVRN